MRFIIIILILVSSICFGQKKDSLPSKQDSVSVIMNEFVKNNFGGFVFGLIVVLAAYTAVGIWEPKYAAGFALVTLLGIAMFWLNR